MSSKDKPVIIVKKIVKGGGGHHGGAWKVAYADFVTAMMAFFLLMWLLASTSQNQRAGIADYFNPRIPMSQTSGGGMGMFGGDSSFSQNKLSHSGLGGSGAKDGRGVEKQDKYQSSTSQDAWSQGAARTEQSGASGGIPKGGDDVDSKDTAADVAKKKSQSVQEETERRLKQASPDLAKHVRFKMTDEGLRIEITDQDGVPMFASGSAEPTPKMRQILQIVASVVKETENPIAVTGHTDGVAFSDASGRSNWDLSAERAAASRRLLDEDGLGGARIRKIEGRADVEPLIAEAPNDARNRRIALVLLRGQDGKTDNKAETPTAK